MCDEGHLAHRPDRGRTSSTGTVVQGKPVVRRGRKARDLPAKTAQLPIDRRNPRLTRSQIVKANLARFTWALALLASMALTGGAGLRWEVW
jgi:hypothetical protein